MSVLIDCCNFIKIYEMGDIIINVLVGVLIMINQGEYVVVMGVFGLGKLIFMNLFGVLDIFIFGEL